MCGHKHWCGIAGEVDKDFEVRDTDTGKGKGIFALKDFAKNDKIMAERFAMSSDDYQTVPFGSVAVEAAILQLEPLNTFDLKAKFHLNAMKCSESGEMSGLFINMSRINHDCLGNSEHFYVENHKVKILLASRDIRAGEEITFSYIGDSPSMKSFLVMKWGFNCSCPTCQNPFAQDMLQEVAALDKQIIQMGQNGNVPGAINAAKRLIWLYDQLGTCALMYSRTYYDLFSLNVCQRSTLNKAKEYIKRAYEAECAVYYPCADDACGSIEKYREYMENITSHHNYRRAG